MKILLLLSLISLYLNKLMSHMKVCDAYLFFFHTLSEYFKKGYYLKTLCPTTLGEKRRELCQFSENFGCQIAHLGNSSQGKIFLCIRMYL